MALEDLAEVVPVDRERDGEREQPRPHEEGPEKELPVLKTLSSDDAEPHDRFKRGHDVGKRKPGLPYFYGPILNEKGLYSRIVVFRRVDGMQDRAVAREERF